MGNETRAELGVRIIALAKRALQAGGRVRARAVIRKIARAHSRSPDILAVCAKALTLCGDEASGEFLRWRAAGLTAGTLVPAKRAAYQPASRKAEPSHAEALLNAGKACQAFEAGIKEIALNPGSAQAALLEKIVFCLDPGEIETAYKRIIEAAPSCPDNWYHLALFRHRAGDDAGMRAVAETFIDRFESCANPMQLYVAALCADRFADAFSFGERVLSMPYGDFVYSRLWNPWGDRVSSRSTSFYSDRLSALERVKLPARFKEWGLMMRGVLLFSQEEQAAAMAVFSGLKNSDATRYGWMRFPAGWLCLYKLRFAEAAEYFSAAAKSPFSRFPAGGRMAEVLFCTGRRSEALAAITRVRVSSEGTPYHSSLLAWEGELLLFSGKYEEAIALERLALKGHDDAAHCWLGAALACSGKLAEALTELDIAVKLFPTDMEARTWRAEVLRRLGDARRSRSELREVFALRARHPWALVNRALLSCAEGDIASALNDIVEARAVLGLEKGSARKPEREAQALLSLARGNRRDDLYFNKTMLAKPQFCNR